MFFSMILINCNLQMVIKVDAVIVSSRQDAQVLVDSMTARYRQNPADCMQVFAASEESKVKYTLIAQFYGGFSILENDTSFKADRAVDYIMGALQA